MRCGVVQRAWTFLQDGTTLSLQESVLCDVKISDELFQFQFVLFNAINVQYVDKYFNYLPFLCLRLSLTLFAFGNERDNLT